MSPVRAFLLIVFTSCLSGYAQNMQFPPPGSSAPPSEPLNTPTLVSTVRQVVLDVVVSDKRGMPVTGLRRSDFAISEDGVPQTINSFVEQDASTEGETQQTAPPEQLPPNTFADHAPVINKVAMTAIVFDTNELEWQDGYYARYEVAQYLKSVKPGTPLCIFKLDNYGLQLIQDFTTDSVKLKKAVESKRNAQWPQLYPQIYQSPRGIALRQLASYLSSFPGRKNLIWFGGGDYRMFSGLPGTLLPDLETFKKELEGVTDTLILSRVAIYIVDPRGVLMDPDEWMNATWQGQDMAKAAEASGGESFYNNNGLKQIVAKVVADGSHYYTLSYRPTNTYWDGSYRHIEVTLQNAGQAALASQSTADSLRLPFHLEYRSGYFARRRPSTTTGPSSEDTRRRLSYSPRGDPNGPGAATRTPLQQAMLFGSVAPFKILFRVTITPSPAKQKIGRHEHRPKDNFLQPQWVHKPYRDYRINFAVDARSLQFAQPDVGSYYDNLQFVTVIYDGQGDIVNSMISTARIALTPTQFVQVMREGLTLDKPIAVPAHGDFFFRFGVFEPMSDRIGALEVPEEQISLHPPSAPIRTAGSQR